MTNLLYEDRQTTLNLKLFALTFFTFIALLVSIGTSTYFLLIPFTLTLYITFTFINRWYIKKMILPKAFQVNAFKRTFIFSFEKYGILKAEYGKLIFTDLKNKSKIIMDTAEYKGSDTKLSLHIISPATNLHIKTLEIRKGIYRYRVPIEVWNLLYDKLPAFKVNSDDYKLYKLPKKLMILLNLYIGFSPLLTKIFFNLLFNKSIFSSIDTFDLVLTGILLMATLLSFYKMRLKSKNQNDLNEIEVLDPYRLMAKEVRGLGDASK